MALFSLVDLKERADVEICSRRDEQPACRDDPPTCQGQLVRLLVLGTTTVVDFYTSPSSLHANIFNTSNVTLCI